MVGSDLDMEGNWAAYFDSRIAERRYQLNLVEQAEVIGQANLDWARDRRKEIDAEFPELRNG